MVSFSLCLGEEGLLFQSGHLALIETITQTVRGVLVCLFFPLVNRKLSMRNYSHRTNSSQQATAIIAVFISITWSIIRPTYLFKNASAIFSYWLLKL